MVKGNKLTGEGVSGGEAESDNPEDWAKEGFTTKDISKID